MNTPFCIDVDENTFNAEVVQRSDRETVIVDFWAPWCGPCRTLGPLLEKIADEKAGAFMLVKINVDDCPNIAGQFGVDGIPAVFAIRERRVVDTFTGVMPEAQLRQFIESVMPGSANSDLTHAFQLETTAPDEAEAIFRKLIAADPNADLAKLGLARVLVAKKQYTDAGELLKAFGDSGDIGVEAQRLRNIIALQGTPTTATSDDADLGRRIAADPENAQLRLELGRALAAQSRYEEALEALLAAAERDREIGRTEVKDLMVQIFQILGVRSPTSDEYRARLQRLLY